MKRIAALLLALLCPAAQATTIIPRQTHYIFGNTGTTADFAQFGSQVAAAPLKTKNILTIQGLGAWQQGWGGALYGANQAPLKEDFNSAFYEPSYQLGYLFQWGIPEWDSGTEYETGSYVQGPKGGASAGQRFVSLQDGNTGNAPPAGASNAFWSWDNPPLPTSFGFGNALKYGESIKPNSGAPTTKVDLGYDILSVLGVNLTSVAVTANTAAGVGPNGLDAGTLSNNTWYALHVITNDSGSQTASLISLSGTAPALPATYTKFRLMWWVYINGSGAITQFQKSGDWCIWTDAALFSLSIPNGTYSMRSYGMSPTSTLGKFNGQSDGAGYYITWTITGTSLPSRLVVGSNDTVQNVIDLATNSSQQMNLTTSGVATLSTVGYLDPH